MTDRKSRYAELAKEINAVVDGEPNRTARMATVACLVHQAFPDRFIWTGFYVLDPDKENELVVGPYQGGLGCLRIPFGKGVCGAAAARRESIIVDDVHAFDGHIACDARARSELVVPVFDPAAALIAVLDIDSAKPGAFDDTDRQGAENIIHDVFAA